MARLDPHLVVSDRPSDVDPGDPSGFCVGGERGSPENPGLEDLLAAMDETGRLLRAGRGPGAARRWRLWERG